MISRCCKLRSLDFGRTLARDVAGISSPVEVPRALWWGKHGLVAANRAAQLGKRVVVTAVLGAAWSPFKPRLRKLRRFFNG